MTAFAKDTFIEDAGHRIVFLLVSSDDGETEIVEITPTVEVSINGAAFSAASGSPVEIGNGWYYIDLSSTELGTVGPVIVRAYHASSKVWRSTYEVVAAAPDVNVASVDEGVTVDANIVSEDAGYTPSDATLATATKQSIADYVLSRTAAQLRTAGLMPTTEAEFRSTLIGAIFATAGVNYLSGGALITEDEEGNTAITRTAATNAGAEPITGLTVPA